MVEQSRNSVYADKGNGDSAADDRPEIDGILIKRNMRSSHGLQWG